MSAYERLPRRVLLSTDFYEAFKDQSCQEYLVSELPSVMIEKRI